MKQSTVFILIAAAFGLLVFNFFLFSVVMELLRQRNDIEVLIGIVIVPCLIMFDYLSITKIYKKVKQ
jgi:tetrahydromethanopterin S-methyltransferase subunit E